MKIYLTMDSMVGEGGYDISGNKNSKKFMKKTVKKVMKDLDVNKHKAIAAMTVALAIIGNGYHNEDYLESFETDTLGVKGIQVKLEFSSLEQMDNLFSEILYYTDL